MTHKPFVRSLPAFEEGHTAYFEGLDVADCPYSPGEARAAWKAGFFSKKREMENYTTKKGLVKLEDRSSSLVLEFDKTTAHVANLPSQDSDEV